MDVRVGLWRRLSTEELMLLKCGVGEDSWESLGLQGDPTSPFWRRSTLGFLWKEWCWSSNSHVKSCLIGKDSDAGRDWGQEEKGTTEDEMVGWHYQLDGREFEWTPGVGDGQGGLACCNSWGREESDTTKQLNWTENEIKFKIQFLSLTGPISGAQSLYVESGCTIGVCMYRASPSLQSILDSTGLDHQHWSLGGGHMATQNKNQSFLS